MKILNRIILAGALLCSMPALAVPAKRISYTVTQPDGTEVTLTKAGDEFIKFYLTADNQVVFHANDGYYFATIGNDGAAIPSDILAADPDKRNDSQKAFVKALNAEKISIAMNLTAERSKLAPAKAKRSFENTASRSAEIPQIGVGLNPGNKNFTSIGSPRVLILLVEYSDVKFKTANSQSYFSSMLNEKGFSKNGATGSALDWFTDASAGHFTPQFDVYGPVTLPNNRAYYGANDFYGSDARAYEMVIDACNALDSSINFKDYDNNNDGMLDNVYLFYAGEGEADSEETNAVWPHQWDLSGAGLTITLDGVTIDHYGCSNEWDINYNRAVGIGTFVHEFSHVLGLPDLYHTKSNSAYYTPCEWSVMDYGSYNDEGRTPPTYSIFERNAYGWAEIEILEKEPKSVELEHILTSNRGYLIPVPGKTTEFFLLENRQLRGWDAYIPGHGMLIWHIDYNTYQWGNNTVNNNKSHQYVDIVEANNNSDGSNASTLAGWAFPGTKNVTSFTDTSTPCMRSWGGLNLETPITEIAESGSGIISFDVCGGKPAIEAPVALQPSNSQISESYFIASWLPVDGAVDYLLTVNTEGEETILTDINSFGAKTSFTNADGWRSSTTTTYTSSGNYGQSSPSFKMGKNGDWFATPAYDGPIVKVNFWVKGMTQTTNPLIIYSVENDNEIQIGTMTDWNQSSGVVREFIVPNESTRQLKFVFSKPSAGNLAVDDVTVTYNATTSAVLDDYNDRSSSGALEMVVNCPKSAVYSYSVKAVNADGKISKPSQKITVSFTSGIETVITDSENAPVEYFNLQGCPVENPDNGLYIRRQGSKVEKVIL